MITKYIKNRLFIISVLIIASSCNRFSVQPYFNTLSTKSEDTIENENKFSYSKKSIILTSDSTLNYSIILGGIGISTTIKYAKTTNEISLDSVDIYNRKTFQNITNEIFGRKFNYTKDSLIDKINNEVYYSDKFVKKRIKENKYKGIYIIANGKKKKVTIFNRNRIMKRISSKEYDIELMSKEDASINYGIEKNYTTIKMTRK